MSDRQQGQDWWLASDGKWYPPQSRQPPPAPPPRPSPAGPETSPIGYAQLAANVEPVRRFLSSGLTGTVFGFLIASSAAAAIAAILYVSTFDQWTDWNEVGAISLGTVIGTWNTADGFAALFSILYITTAVLFIIWGNHAYKAAQSTGAIEQKWSSGWAVGGWFIPFANIVIPKMVINEIDRMSRPDLTEPIGTTWRGQPRLATSDWWWALWFSAIALVGIASGVVNEFAGSRLLVQAGGFAAFSAAGILAAITVRTIGRRLSGRWI